MAPGGRRSRPVLAAIDTAPSPSQSRRSLNKITVDPGKRETTEIKMKPRGRKSRTQVENVENFEQAVAYEEKVEIPTAEINVPKKTDKNVSKETDKNVSKETEKDVSMKMDKNVSKKTEKNVSKEMDKSDEEESEGNNKEKFKELESEIKKKDFHEPALDQEMKIMKVEVRDEINVKADDQDTEENGLMVSGLISAEALKVVELCLQFFFFLDNY